MGGGREINNRECATYTCCYSGKYGEYGEIVASFEQLVGREEYGVRLDLGFQAKLQE